MGFMNIRKVLVGKPTGILKNRFLLIFLPEELVVLVENIFFAWSRLNAPFAKGPDQQLSTRC